MPFRARPYVVEAYCGSPIKRCFKCLRFGHQSWTCVEKQRCAKCGLAAGHTSKDCTSVETPTCINCGGGHSPVDPICPKIIECKEKKREKNASVKGSSTNIKNLAFSSLQTAWNVSPNNSQSTPKYPPLKISDEIQFPPISTSQTLNTINDKTPTKEVESDTTRELDFENRILEKMNTIFDQKFRALEEKFNNIIDLVTKKFNQLNIPNNTLPNPSAQEDNSMQDIRSIAERRIEDVLEAKTDAMLSGFVKLLEAKVIPLLTQGANAHGLTKTNI